MGPSVPLRVCGRVVQRDRQAPDHRSAAAYTHAHQYMYRYEVLTTRDVPAHPVYRFGTSPRFDAIDELFGIARSRFRH